MFGSAHSAMRLPHSLVSLDLRRRYWVPLYRVSARRMLCLYTISPGARALGMSFSATIELSPCLNSSSCLKRGLLRGGTYGWRSAVFGRELRFGDVVWLDFRAPHRYRLIDVTVTSARTNTGVPEIGARLPLPGSIVLGAH
jgi:hypothetical protein